jgi:hypothetical protein
MESASYRLFDSEVDPASRAAAEVVTGITTEYGQQFKGGGYDLWNTAPYVERVYPVAERIKDERRNGGKVYRRRVIVVEDWTEVAEP